MSRQKQQEDVATLRIIATDLELVLRDAEWSCGMPRLTAAIAHAHQTATKLADDIAADRRVAEVERRHVAPSASTDGGAS